MVTEGRWSGLLEVIATATITFAKISFNLLLEQYLGASILSPLAI